VLRSIGWLAWVIVAYLLSAASYELVLALQRSTSEKGLVWDLAILAMLLGAVLAFRRVPATALFAPAAALFVTARSYTGDPYFWSTFRRYADGGNISPARIFLLLGLALVAGATTLLWRRTAPVETTVVLLLLTVTTLFMGLH
jgi:lysylphosphatidylglycerol synthetase-like protein (DUF2156 family)